MRVKVPRVRAAHGRKSGSVDRCGRKQQPRTPFAPQTGSLGRSRRDPAKKIARTHAQAVTTRSLRRYTHRGSLRRHSGSEREKDQRLRSNFFFEEKKISFSHKKAANALQPPAETEKGRNTRKAMGLPAAAPKRLPKTREEREFDNMMRNRRPSVRMHTCCALGRAPWWTCLCANVRARAGECLVEATCDRGHVLSRFLDSRCGRTRARWATCTFAR